MPLPPVLQNKNVQIGVIAVGLLVGLGFLLFQIMGSNAPPPDASAFMTTGSPYGGPGAYPGPGGSAGSPSAASYPGGSGGPPGGPAAMGYGSDMAAGGAPLTAGKPAALKKAGPRPPARKDPFKTPDELTPPPVPIAERLGPAPGLYVDERTREVLTPTPEQFVRDTPDPPMRMAGALWGNRVYGVLEINGQTQPPVSPGDKIGIYRVERIERDKIVLSRPGRRGRRTVDALLAGNPALAAQYPTGDNGIPGGPTGYGGPAGGGAGGSGGGRSGG